MNHTPGRGDWDQALVEGRYSSSQASPFHTRLPARGESKHRDAHNAAAEVIGSGQAARDNSIVNDRSSRLIVNDRPSRSMLNRENTAPQ